jgi:hypothetical protein
MNDYSTFFNGWWHANPPLSPSTKTSFSSEVGRRVPDEYLEFLEWSNGGQGDTGLNYFTLWKGEELQSLNKGYDIESFLPGCLAIGNDGPNFLFMDTQDRICRTPYGYGKDDMVEVLASSFSDFCRRIKGIE